jgi:hypothetical protein
MMQQEGKVDKNDRANQESFSFLFILIFLSNEKLLLQFQSVKLGSLTKEKDKETEKENVARPSSKAIGYDRLSCAPLWGKQMRPTASLKSAAP